LYQDAELNKDRDINILELLTLISQNPTGLSKKCKIEVSFFEEF